MNPVSDIKLNHNSVVSLHTQIHYQIRQLIISGRWAERSRIPSETQIAKHLNISRGTVRLGFKSAEIEGLIERKAGKGTYVAYRRDTHKFNRLIAFVTPKFESECHRMMLNGAENRLKSHGYRVLFCTTEHNQEEENILKQLQNDRIAGILLWPHTKSKMQNLPAFQHLYIPVVLLDRDIPGVEYDCVTSDNYGGATTLMEHLIDLNHRHIVFLTHKSTDILTVSERFQAYRDVMAKHGLQPYSPWLIGEHGKEIDAAQMYQAYNKPHSGLLQDIIEHKQISANRPTAIFAMNDYIAILAMRAMNYLDLSMPDDISVVGFDDTDVAAYLEVPLTTVKQNNFSIGQHAAQRLIERIQGDNSPPQYERVPTQLCVRSSTTNTVTV